MVCERWEVLTAKQAKEFRQRPIFQQSNWVAAYTRLLDLIPGAEQVISAPCYIQPDAIVRAATAAGIVYESRTIYNPWRRHPEGLGTQSWEDYSDTEVLDTLLTEFPFASDPFWLISDDCFQEHGPYLTDKERLRDFDGEFRSGFHMDTIFIWCESPRITVIHHEGWLFNIIVP